MKPTPAQLARLAAEPNVWLATVRTDGRPHLTPIWFVWVHGAWWLGTYQDAVKVRNVRANDRVSLALESGNDPLVCEGTATLHPDVSALPAEVLACFLSKYDWDLVADSNVCGIEVRPIKWLRPGGT